MKLILFGLLGAIVLFAGTSTQLADAKEMTHVPFWWSTDPLTGERVYTDYFKETSTVLQEHKAYLKSSLTQSESIFSPLVIAEVERSGMIEVITYETKWIKVSESQFDHGPFANPDYTIAEEVAVSTWIKAPVVEEAVIEEITEVITEITPSSVTDITSIITGITGGEQVVEVTEEPQTRVSNNKGNTHWDVNDAEYAGSNSMSSQEFKDMKKKQAEWKAYETASKLYPTLYPAYVHEYEHEEVVVEDKIVVPLYESEVIIDIAPEVTLPSVTSSAVVVPMPEPTPEPTPVPGVTSSTVVVPEVITQPILPQATSIVPQITEQLPLELREPVE